MNSNKQSSVEWLHDELFKSFEKFYTLQFTLEEYQANNIRLYLQAKAMHNEEIAQAWKRGDGQYDNVAEKMSLEYYNETFGGNNDQQ